ncbi:hypothetical protein K490DRAFT_68688 [Saccharata proteae CBS 121410]|uniref:Uncharacterized protein n=1 Tax=Saccharata proteae CBS 121410 TaxID=1314787 RepID=A0A9P4LX25_9PEZI|nr:hypothetical protein K490DRAFT_68688 [Saccharata proteae CBS 121410]
MAVDKVDFLFEIPFPLSFKIDSILQTFFLHAALIGSNEVKVVELLHQAVYGGQEDEYQPSQLLQAVRDGVSYTDFDFESDEDVEVVDTLFIVADHVYGRRLTKTTAGRLGLAPRQARSGDTIVVLHGSRVRTHPLEARRDIAIV